MRSILYTPTTARSFSLRETLTYLEALANDVLRCLRGICAVAFVAPSFRGGSYLPWFGGGGARLGIHITIDGTKVCASRTSGTYDFALDSL